MAVAAAGAAAAKTTAQTVAAYAAAAAAAAGAYASIKSGQTQKEIAEAQMQQARLDADAKRQAAELEVQQHREKAARLKGTQRVSLLSSGVTLEGSALDILADTDVQTRLDEDLIRYNANVGSRSLEQRGLISSFEGSQAASAGVLQAGSTLLKSTGKFATTKTGQRLLS